MNEKEIKKALKCHAKTDKLNCYDCPSKSVKNCHEKLAKDVLELLKKTEMENANEKV